MSYSTTAYPYDTVVYLVATFAGGSLQGSGVLISPDEVLTASHMVYEQGIGVATSVAVAPGYDQGARPYGVVSGTVTHYNPIADANLTIPLSDSQQDYAIVHLAQPLWDLGTMQIQADFPGGQVNVTGYPAVNAGAQVTSTQTATRDPNYTLLDGELLGPGSSGGPVWINAATGPAVVGVVSSGVTATGAGFNTLITSASLDRISGWVGLDDAKGIHATSTLDYNADGYSDLSWQAANGAIVQWDIVGSSIVASGNVGALNPAWSYLGSGDLQGLGKSAMLWRDASGQVDVWQKNGATITGASHVAVATPDWHPLAVGQFGGTGKAGILWQNDAGLVAEWQMDGGTVVSSPTLGMVDASWRFLTAGDFDGNGTADALWQNANGAIEAWQMGRDSIQGVMIGALDSTWKFLAAGDFNGDGKTDLMWQHSDGGITAWSMDGASIIDAGPVGALTPGDWSVVGTGDYNRDGRSDLMLRSAGGTISEWTMDGRTILSAANVGSLDPSWKALS